MSLPAQPLLASAINTESISIPHWQLQPTECWAIIGRNGAGKHHLTNVLTGKTPPKTGSLTHGFRQIGLLSFEQQQRFFEKELKDDDSEFMEGADIGTTVAELLQVDKALPESLGFLGLEPLLQRGYRQLSSGEARKTLLAQQWLQQPDLLILDEPFDSLDRDMRTSLSAFFADVLTQHNMTLLFLLNTLDDVFPWHTHLAVLDNGELLVAGRIEDMRSDPAVQALLNFDSSTLPAWPEALPRPPVEDPLIILHNGHVQYDETNIFSGIELTVRHGSHTLLTGPNGSGKSTLLGLLTGDHPQCYGNDLQLFGRRRGSGETIWELKKKMGIVTPALHRDHRVPGSALHIVLSGFFDTIGLYDAVEASHIRHARTWLELVGLGGRDDVPFKQLSYGEQRLALLARALVKQPVLLILDEPTQGLDDINRARLRYFLEHLASQRLTTVLMASHRQDEFLALFTQHIDLAKAGHG
ncbi:MAG: ATP-binding cassette domain-containing protein [Pseudomonadota bacterium]